MSGTTEVFSNRKIIESLLRDFVAEPWVNLINFDTMTIRKSIFKSIYNPGVFRVYSWFQIYPHRWTQVFGYIYTELFELLGKYIAGLVEK